MKKLPSALISINYLLVFIMLIVSCSGTTPAQKMENITSISMTAWGGELGYHRSLVITPDTLHYELGSSVDTTNNISSKKSNGQYKLDDIISANQLAKFAKIASGESRQPVDGTDTEIKIKTNLKEYSVINAGNNNLWRGILIRMDAIVDREFKEDK